MNIYISGIGIVASNFLGTGKEYLNSDIKLSFKHKITKLSFCKHILEKPFLHFGRLNNYSKIGFLSATYALCDARIKIGRKKEIGMIIATHQGSLETDIKYYKTVIEDKGKFISPNLFAYTLPNCFLGEIANYFKLTGESFVINNNNILNLDSLKFAFDSIRFNGIPRMLCGFCNTSSYLIQNDIEGAIFLLLSKNSKQSYGQIELDSKGNLFFKKRKIFKIADIISEIHKG